MTAVNAQPYGPNTAHIRRFLVRFAGLGTKDRARATTAYASLSGTRAWMAAEVALATAIERSGRDAQRDALSGPLLQLVQREPVEDLTEENVLDTLDPVAEPALAALLALLVQDLLERAHTERLLAPFAGLIAVDALPGAAPDTAS